VLAATVPVATDCALTVPTVAVEVMYFELEDPAKLGPTMASATAPTPTRIKAIAANRVFIGLCLSSLEQLRPWMYLDRWDAHRMYPACC
jgi:hypothetical protein